MIALVHISCGCVIAEAVIAEMCLTSSRHTSQVSILSASNFMALSGKRMACCQHSAPCSRRSVHSMAGSSQGHFQAITKIALLA